MTKIIFLYYKLKRGRYIFLGSDRSSILEDNYYILLFYDSM